MPLPRWIPRIRVERVDQPDVEKAANIAPAATFTPAQVAALLGSVSPQLTGAFNPLPRTDPMVPFSPGIAVTPAAIDPPRPDTGRPEPRLTEYPVSSNLPGMIDRLVPWKVLRDAAGIGGLPRRCIEIRKAEVATLDWCIAISAGAVEQAQADNPGTSRADVEADLRQRLGPEIARCSEFWEQPNRREGESFAEWISKLLEEHLVLDALAIYPRYTYGGDLWSLEILDGSTIKVLRDNTGGRPLPPNPAWQQILWGFPRGEFIADVDADGGVLNGYTADRLIYKRRNVRTFTQYGYSPTEQALEDIDLWLRRRQWIKAEYTEGTVPTGLVRNTGQSGWSPQQVLEYERNLNDVYGGQTAERHRLRVLPPGFELETHAEAAEKYKPEYDLFLVRQVAGHYDVGLADLNFTEPGGLGAAGWHEGQADVQERRGRLPTTRWLQALITSISRQHLAMPGELEFRFLGLEEEDEAAADAVADTRVGSGRMTYNEDRDRLGLPRFEFPEADMPIIKTSRGVIFLEGASQLAPAGETITPVEGPPLKDTDADGLADSFEPEEDAAEQDSDSSSQERADAVKAELSAYRRWAKRNPSSTRRFEFQVVEKADAPHLVADRRVVFKAGDPDPKVPDNSRSWPGWDRDLEAAHAWVPRIRKAMRNSVDARLIAERWLASQLVTKADEPELGDVDEPEQPDTFSTDPRSWLAEHGIDLVTALAIVRELWTEGYAIGHLSAQAVLLGRDTVDWSSWKPGDANAARLVLDENGRNGLALMLDQAGITIRSIASNRLDKLADALADALVHGDSVDTLARTLRDVLDDPRWAELVATTEISRAVSQAALDIYATNGIQQVSWLTAEDQRVCTLCSGNEAAGPIQRGASFPGGAAAPPQHPACRCTLVPVVDSMFPNVYT